MAGEIYNDFCEGSSDSGDDEDREDFLGRKIHPDKAFKLLQSITERKTMKLQCLRTRRRRKRSKALAPVDFAKDGSTGSGRSRLEDEYDQSDTFSEVKSSSSFGTSNFIGNTSRKDLSAFDLHDDTPTKKNSLKLTYAPLTGNHSKGLLKLQKRPQPPKWRASSRAEHSTMSSLVSTVIRQDREDKAVAAVHLPKASREGYTKAPHHLQDEAVHLGNGKNGVALDTDVNYPASPSHRKVAESASHSVFDFGSESDPDSPMDCKGMDLSLTSRIDDLQRFLAEDALS